MAAYEIDEYATGLLIVNISVFAVLMMCVITSRKLLSLLKAELEFAKMAAKDK